MKSNQLVPVNHGWTRDEVVLCCLEIKDLITKCCVHGWLKAPSVHDEVQPRTTVFQSPLVSRFILTELVTTLLLSLSRDNGLDHQVLCPVHECLKACSQCFKRKFSHLAPITRASGSRTVAFGRGRIIPVNELDRHAVYLSISTVFTNYSSISTRNLWKRRVGTVWPSDEIIYSFSTFYLSDLFVIIIATKRMYLIQSNLCGTVTTK